MSKKSKWSQHKRKQEAKPSSEVVRSEDAVFEDIRALTQSPGFIHALAYLIFKSNVILGREEFTKDDFLKIYDPKNLIRTEANLLIALMFSTKIDQILPSQTTIQEYLDRAVNLLEELHQTLVIPAQKLIFSQLLNVKKGTTEVESPFKSGAVLRESIFYGAESAFPFQYIEMAKERYAADKEWLEDNKGFNIEEAAAVMLAVRDIVVSQYTAHLRDIRHQSPHSWTLLPPFSFTIDGILSKCGLAEEKVISVVEAFTTKEGAQELDINNSSEYNRAATHPLLLLEDGTRLSFLEYNLFECLYENPFYWIGQDKKYLGIHSQTRGNFVETFTERMLVKVFGDNHVLKNVIFQKAEGDRLGEADAILVYGYRAFIIQAKSKKLTLAARAGDDVSLGKDFQSAVQEAYDQAVECISHIKNGVPYYINGEKLDDELFKSIREFYPICITSEHYPSLAVQSRELLKIVSNPDIMHPFVTDVFTLDVLAEMLESPLYFIDYLIKRSAARDRVFANHELIIFSWYLKKNLHIEDDEFYTLSDDILVELDLAMAVRRVGIAGLATPEGQLTRFAGTPIGRLIDVINASTRPDVHRLGELLLGLSGDTAEALNQGITKILSQTQSDGKKHDITIGVENSGGITVHCNTLELDEARELLASHCAMRKYTEKKDQWFGVSLAKDGQPRFMMGIEQPWAHNPDLEEEAGDFRVRSVTHAFRPDRSRKIGRNEQCPCGSGKKYKRCHGF